MRRCPSPQESNESETPGYSWMPTVDSLSPEAARLQADVDARTFCMHKSYSCVSDDECSPRPLLRTLTTRFSCRQSLCLSPGPMRLTGRDPVRAPSQSSL